MASPKLSLNLKTVALISMGALNLLTICGGWMLSHLWTETVNFRAQTEVDIGELKEELGKLSLECSRVYLTKSAFHEYQEQQGELYRHLDSKIR